MVERIKIGLTFSYNEGWIGGTYYVMNLIHALNALDDVHKPFLIILSKDETDFEKVKAIQYPYIDYQLINKTDLSLPARIINKLARPIFKDNLIKIKPHKQKIDVLFWGTLDHYFRKIPIHLFWIPDFQEVHLPTFFSAKQIESRRKKYRHLVQQKKDIVFSSQDANNDFNQLFPNAKGNSFILNFAVSHPKEYKKRSIDTLKKKYDLTSPYFFCPNQFWKHKNHMLVLNSLKELKSKGQLNFTVAFSGKESDQRNPNYFKGLKTFVRENNLENNIRFLGFIDRKDQLQLMNHALAIVQPSLFEGWSTVVEDAKAMNQNIIISDLDVHKEQLGDTGYFFDRNSSIELTKQLMFFNQNQISRPEFHYEKKVHEFGDKFMTIIKKLIADNA